MRNGVLWAVAGLLTFALGQVTSPAALAQSCGADAHNGSWSCAADGCASCGKAKKCKSFKLFGRRKAASACCECWVVDCCGQGHSAPSCGVDANGVEGAWQAPGDAPSSPSGSEPTLADPPVPDDPVAPTEASRFRNPPNSYTSISFDPPSQAMTQGMQHYWSGSFGQAIEDLTLESRRQPQDAVPLYYLALALKRDGQSQRAEQVLREASDTEQFYPVVRWGQRMQRVQGQDRVWIDSARP